MHTLSVLGDINIVVDESVAKESPRITIRLDHVSLEEALDLIAQTKGLLYRKTENAVIFERSDIAEPCVVRLQYANAEDVKKSIGAAADALKLKIEADTQSNALIIAGSPTGMLRIKQIIGALDVRLQQVELEAKVIAISEAATKQLGIEWEWDEFPKTYEYQPPTSDGSSGKITSPATITRHTPVGDGYPGIIQYGRSPEGLPYEFYYSAKINALVSKGDAKVLSRPKVTTVSGKEARILIGDRIPVQTETVANGTTSISTTYLDTGIKLTYTPVIGNDGRITAKVHTEVSTPQLVADTKQYQITTREAETYVSMKNGETMIIGGLIGSQTSETISKVPFFSDFPILGNLFKNVQRTGSNSEIIIFLTPHII
ncbi:secretin N-terminal domain-containing protein [Propionispora sp. 2/2-37]|uniref:secretin N-terminal domain-containing protein n=1 Tax=Propionispora sp. 2/2-37 TaxID=1677858 RepID=UPI001C11E79C|nr:secretin N-terminal domain-containing protein [Propionispora sp. 2/2-37]